MLEGILFELTLIIMKRSGFETETITVLECPADKEIQELHEKYSTPSFRVYVTCGPYIETRCNRVAMKMSGVKQESCSDDW